MKNVIASFLFIFMFSIVVAQAPTDPFPMLSSYGSDPNYYQVFNDVDEWIRENPLNTQYEAEIKFHSRAQYFMEPRLDQEGSMKGYVNNYYNFMRNAFEISCDESFIESNWLCIGPSEDPAGSDQFLGYLQTVWIDPNDEDHILVGNNGGGIWETKSTYNSPFEWKYITENPGFPGMGIRKIAVDPSDESRIYVSTYMRQVLVYQRDYGVGVMFSEDGGITWEIDEYFLDFINDPPSPILSDVPVFLPYTYNIKYLPKYGGGYDLYLPYFNFLLKKDFAIGEWEPLPGATLEIDAIYRDVQNVPGDPNFLVATYSYPSAGALYSNVQYSNDGGSTWSTMSYMIGAQTTLVSIPDNESIFVLYEYEVGGEKVHDLYHYDVTGVSPALIDNFTPVISKCGNCKLWIEKMIVSPTNNDIIYLADRQGVVLKSVDGGNNFDEISTYSGDLHCDIRDLVLYKPTTDNLGDNPGDVSTGDHDILFAATDGGLGKTMDGGDTWISYNKTGLNINNSMGFANSELDRNRILLTAGDGNGFIHRETGWSRGPNGDNGHSVISNLSPNLGIYEGTLPSSKVFSKITISPGGGYSTAGNIPSVPLFIGYTTTDNVNTDKKPFTFKDRTNDFWTGTTDLYSIPSTFPTTGGIYDWNRESNFWYLDPTMSEELRVNQPITAMEIAPDPNDPTKEYKYVAVKWFQKLGEPINIEDIDDHKIIRFDPNNAIEPYKNITPYLDEDVYPFTDGGFWSGFNEGWVSDIAVNPANPEELWVGFTKAWYDEGEAHWRVMYSPDAGETWYDRSEGLPDFPINRLLYWKGSDDILFAGTDVGVYIFHRTPFTSNGEGTWECFGTGMPLAFITDLEIVYCANKLRACTYGQSVWETELPYLNDDFSDSYNPIVVTSDLVWDKSMDAYTDIIIKSGASLTIVNCEIRMPMNGKIVVENGGKLVVDAGTITNHCDFWKGIEVWGKGNSVSHPEIVDVITGVYPEDDSDHGVVYLRNNAKIESAEIAISTYNSDYPTSSIYYGGIVVAHDSEFHNNIISLYMHPFDVAPSNTDDDNVSEFYMCSFKRDNQMPCETYVSSEVFLVDIDGVLFHACDFENTFSGCTDFDFPIGINSTNSTYTVESACDFLAEEGCEEFETSFSGYFRGIIATNTSPRPRPITINDVVFANNERAVLFSSILNSEIWRCKFEIPDFENRTGYGLYLEGCINYHVEGNNFTWYDDPVSATDEMTNTVYRCSGIFVENNHNTATEIYRNTFENIEIGVRSQGNNSKLQIRCNEFIDPIVDYDIIVTSGTLGNQGICNATITQPAGNQFSPSGAGESDFRIVPSGVSLNYRHHTEPVYIPVDYTTTQINLHNCSVSGAEDCVSTLPGGTGGEERMMMSEAADYQTAIDIELAKIDGGNTEEMIADIQGEGSQTEVKFALDEASPYISNDVLVALVNEEPLGTTDVLDVMDNNYPISDTVAASLELSNYQVPSAVIETLSEDVVDNMLTVSAMSDLLATVAVLETKREYAVLQSINHLVDEIEIDSAIALVAEEPGDWARQQEVQILTSTSNYNEAKSALEQYISIDQFGEDFKVLYTVINDIESTERTLAEITASEESTLRSIASKETSAGIASQNILSHLYKEESYPEIIDEIPEIQLRLTDEVINNSSSDFRIYPNPADEVVFVELKDLLDCEYFLYVYDITGVRVLTSPLRNDYRLTWIDTKDFQTGIYFFEVFRNGNSIGAEKVVVE